MIVEAKITLNNCFMKHKRKLTTTMYIVTEMLNYDNNVKRLVLVVVTTDLNRCCVKLKKKEMLDMKSFMIVTETYKQYSPRTKVQTITVTVRSTVANTTMIT